MPRRFNTAGPCLASDHYMLPATRRTPQVHALVDSGLYFAVHAARQTGKTTLIRNFARELTASGRFAAVAVSLEWVTGEDPLTMMPMLTDGLLARAREQLPAELSPPAWTTEELGRNAAAVLRNLLAAWSSACPLPVVLFFDEIDSLPPDVLVSVLRQLRDGYCSRPAPFPHSVALVGMRDVRDYRAAVRDPAATLGTASPFNIKSESLSLRNFDAAEVAELLGQHTAETGQRFDDDAVAELFEQTQGQPWLVNALAALLTTQWNALVPERSVAVSRDKVLEAKELLIERRDTHLDSLVARLHEPRVRRVIEPVMTGELSVDATYDADWSYVRDLGLVSIRDGKRQIANPIYQEIIPRVLTHQVQTGIALEPACFVAADGGLDVGKLLEAFVGFWRRHGEVLLRGMPYQEAAPHLVLMAYLQRVVNGGGRVHREFAVGTGRADLVVELGGRSDVIELKLQRGKHTLPDGLLQVARYAKRLGRDVGYLVVFDPKATTPWDERGVLEELLEDGVRITVLRA